VSAYQPQPEVVVYRTCPECGGTRFRLVGYRNATYLVCERSIQLQVLGAGGCRSRPFPSGQKGHLGRAALLDTEIVDIKALLPGDA
jgi:hypothetical protein